MKTINNMSRVLIYMLSLFVTVSCNGQGNSIQWVNNQIIGKWEIVDYKPGNITALTNDEAEKYIGKTVRLNNKYMVYFGDSVNTPKYEFRKEAATPFLYENYKINKNLLAIEKDSVVVFDITSNEKTYHDVIFVSSEKLIYNIDGMFFILKKVYDKEIALEEFKGKGDFEKRIDLSSCDFLLSIEYNFFSIQDKLIIEDLSGNVLLETEMKATKFPEEKIADINLQSVNECSFLIKVISSQKDNSQWQLKVKISEY